ncbi:GMC family oxidoreductase [Asticcacaulis sp. AC460]|uniref:GMC oxidoreductase n=1 Tax=Asticcacaulis sp. AC460 TaxID=1282360 RepID=UPI0003C3F490|nr:GMC family oxidoreductase [Asticcacaulis sp. AC460]ESQ91754.1 GMC family oxidoreductase [Asticcacaulis sp. AC460]
MNDEFDAIVIGSGMSGGWAAKELCEKGLKVLVLERGRELSVEKDYSDMLSPWELPNLDRINEEELKTHYPVAAESVGYALHETTKQFWVKEDEQPYETPEGAPFEWLRGYHSGGKSLMWSRQSYRFGPQDFESNKKDGHGVDWPIRYDDLAPWYDHVERFAGISGNRDGIPSLPDGQFQPAFELTQPEKAFAERVNKAFPSRHVIAARVAHLTQPTQEQMDLGRGPCQVRNHCHRGCSFGAYFSSVSATLPAARRTENLTLISYAIVQAIDYDPVSKRATGVRVMDANTRETKTYTARIIFLNASTVASTLIMLNSKSEAFPTGLANSSGQLGHNLMDHFGGAGAGGELPEFDAYYHAGRRPGGIYVANYANITEHDKPFLRGYGFQGGSSRPGWTGNRPGIGEDFKQANRTPKPWTIGINAFGDMLPNFRNNISLHPTKTDKWGMPVAVIDCRLGENELKMMQAASKDALAMMKAAGCTNIWSSEDRGVTMESLTSPGNKIHEMGTARMGRDPKTSVLNGWCQSHDVPNLFITDGSCMPSSAVQNPSLTYMALTARAANHAAELVKAGVL